MNTERAKRLLRGMLAREHIGYSNMTAKAFSFGSEDGAVIVTLHGFDGSESQLQAICSEAKILHFFVGVPAVEGKP